MPETKKPVSLEEVVKECEMNELPMDARRLRYNITHGLLKKPTRTGRQAYYDKDYIYTAIACILLLSKKFHFGLRKRKAVMSSYRGSEKMLIDKLKTFLDRYQSVITKPTYYSLVELAFLDRLEAGDQTIDFDKIEKEVQETTGNQLKKK